MSKNELFRREYDIGSEMLLDFLQQAFAGMPRVTSWRLADSGVGVLMVSSEVPEVLGLADRVVVMREGRVVRQASAADLDEHAVLDLVMAGSLLEGSLT